MSLSLRLAAAAYLLKRLVLKGEVPRFAPSGLPAPWPSVPPEAGVVDGVSGHAVRGWARRVDDPETLVRVDVYLGDEFVGRAACNLPRQDLAGRRGFHATGRHGFEFRLPEHVWRLGVESGLPLSGSPVQLERAAPAEIEAAVPDILSKVWYTGAPPAGLGSLAQIRSAYGDRLAVLTQIDPQACDATWPVTRVMSYVNARNYGGRLPYHGSSAYFSLLVAAAAHFASTRAGLPMERTQVEALNRPTGWLLAERVRATVILDAFARTCELDERLDETAVADFLAKYVVDLLAQYRLPVELLGEDARAFLQHSAITGGLTRFELAFSRSARFAGASSRTDPATVAAAVRMAIHDLGLQELATCAAATPLAPQAPQPQRQGVRIITGDHGESGLSLNARNSLSALKSIGVETAVFAAPLSSPADPAAYDDLGRPPFSTALLHLPPHDAVEVIVRRPPEQARAHLIGFFMWETETLPEAHRLGVLLVDEIWTATRYCERIFSAAAHGTPVRIVGHAVRLAEPEPGFDARAWAGVEPADFVFLFHFDAHSWITRKNPIAIVRAFRLAFGPQTTDVRLIVKLRRSEDADLPQWRQWWEEFYEEAAWDDRIIIMRETLNDARMSALTHASDAFVSLHRSEGFGYGLAEAMLAAKPTIATAYSGNLDFTLPGETLLVSAPVRPIRDGEFLYAGPAQAWGEPNLEEAASAMRTLYTDRTLAEQLGRRGRERVIKDCSLDALATRYARALTPPASTRSPQPASRS